MLMISHSSIPRPLRYLAGVTLGSLLLLGASAQAQTRPSLTQLQQQLDALRQQVTAQQTTIATQQTTITNLTTRLAVVEGNPALALGPYVSVALTPLNGLPGPHILWTGANLHVRSGSGATDGALTGRGNLLVGYNEFFTGSGSHNIVVGLGHTLSSFGGLVAGFSNTISAPYASVTGGERNTASGLRASVSGGESNTASGLRASVTGGHLNLASGLTTSVGGGNSNEARNTSSSVHGGFANRAVGEGSSVSGGLNNESGGQSPTISGGLNNESGGQSPTISGGAHRFTDFTGINAWVGGGLFQAN